MAKENEMMKVVLLEPGKIAKITEIDGSLEGMQKVVGGYIEAFYPFEEEVCMVCNEEGKLIGMSLNRSIKDEDGKIFEIIAGPCFICDCSGENFGSLSEEQAGRYKEKFLLPERFMRMEGEIIAIPYRLKSKEQER